MPSRLGPEYQDELNPVVTMRALWSRLSPHWRTLAALMVLLLAIGAFAAGVTTSSYPDPLPPVAWLYFAASLFLFGGTDVGTPLPEAGFWPGVALWTSYLLAPLITTTVAVDAVRGLMAARGQSERDLDDHVVLVGSDALALAYLEAIAEVDPGRVVVLVEHRDGLSGIEFERSARGERVRRARGNVLQPGAYDRLRLDRAHTAVIMSANDALNLECAWSICHAHPQLKVAAHVAELALLRPVNRLLRAQREHASDRAPAVFSTHRFAVLQLYDEHIEPHFADTLQEDVVFVAGFGHLGQTLTELLLMRGEEEIERLVVVDPDAPALMREFSLDVDLIELQPEAIDGALTDPASWDRALAAVPAGVEQSSGVALLTADNETNLRVAMLLQARFPGLALFAVCATRNTFMDAMAPHIGLRVFYLDEMLSGALRDHYEALAAA
ncbi:MAG: hypothetical protein ACO3P1_10425 [Pseudomonadales bacterium]